MDDIGDVLQLGVTTQNDSGSRANLNISDVFEAISIADPSFGAGVVEDMYRPAAAPAPAPSGAIDRPYVRIVEQPAGKSLRFRYECEGRSAGSIPGASSTPERKTYPTIEVCGYKGRFVVLVSCVTKDKPYRPHPHNLVGREPACSRGVCTVEMNGDSSLVQFSNLGIQCVKRKDIAEALRAREEMKVDPFKTGFSHKSQPQQIDLNAVRLCFQVYIPGEKTSKIKQALHPVVSDVIYDKKAMCELQINRISTCAGSVKGGTELILLCEKVTREDIEVVFSQQLDAGFVWEAPANIVLVHKQVAIAFQAPPYRDPAAADNVKVQICLRRVSDQARSAPVDFEYTPDFADSDYLGKKKRKTAHIELFQQSYKQDRGFMQDSPIKTEPRDASPGLQIQSPASMMSPHYQPATFPDPADPRYQQWIPEQSNLSVPGGYADARGYWGPHDYGSPAAEPRRSPHAPMPGMAQSPMQGVVSPMQGVVSPMQGVVSPVHHMSPMHQQSPMHHPSPMHQPSPMLQPSPTPQMQPMNMPLQAMDPGDSMANDEAFDSADLSGIIKMLNRAPELSDSLRALSTSDLIQVNAQYSQQ